MELVSKLRVLRMEAETSRTLVLELESKLRERTVENEKMKKRQKREYSLSGIVVEKKVGSDGVK